jgi:hypothetical protein
MDGIQRDYRWKLASVDPRPGSSLGDVRDHLPPQCPTFSPEKSGAASPEAANCATSAAFNRSNPASDEASHRATSTAWVLDDRSSHQPSSVSTRTPSVSDTRAPETRKRAATAPAISYLRHGRQGDRRSRPTAVAVWASGRYAGASGGPGDSHFEFP